VSVALSVSSVFFFHPMVALPDMILVVSTAALLVISLRRQHNSDLPQGLRNLTWILAGWFVITMLVGLSYGFWLGLSNPDLWLSPNTYPNYNLDPRGPFYTAYCFAGAFVVTPLAVLGILRVFRLRPRPVRNAESAASESSPAEPADA
jgi:hypothetical protein